MTIDKGGVFIPPASFENLEGSLRNAIVDSGITDLNHLQLSMISVLTSGTDLMVTGGFKAGRTTALIIGLLAAILQLENPSGGNGPKALVLFSTREASMEAYTVASNLALGCGLSAQLVIGRSQDPMVNQPSGSYDLVIATPGKAFDAVLKGRIASNRLRFLAFDEGHETLGTTGGGDHSRAMLRLMSAHKSQIRRSVVSNTALKDATESFLRPSVTTTLRVVRSTAEWKMRHVPTTADNKPAMVGRVIEAAEAQVRTNVRKQFLIFVPRIDDAERLTGVLTRDLQKEVDVVFSRKTSQERLATIHRFNNSETDVLVSCRIAASGISLANVVGVIFYNSTVAWQLLIGMVNKMAQRSVGRCYVMYDSRNPRDLERVEAIGKRYEAECLGTKEANTDELAPHSKYSLNATHRPTRTVIVKSVPQTFSIDDFKRSFPWDDDYTANPVQRACGLVGTK
jgi:ATP-dependent RNA helicase RhlE